jgi:hypothetical protein
MAWEKLPDGAKVDLNAKVEDETGAEIDRASLSFRAQDANDISAADRQADAAAEEVAAPFRSAGEDDRAYKAAANAYARSLTVKQLRSPRLVPSRRKRRRLSSRFICSVTPVRRHVRLDRNHDGLMRRRRRFVTGTRCRTKNSTGRRREKPLTATFRR